MALIHESDPEVRRTFSRSVLVSALCGAIALMTRFARGGVFGYDTPLYRMAATDVSVGFEHFAAGAVVSWAVLWMVLVMLTSSYWFPHRRSIAPAELRRATVQAAVAAAIIYAIGILGHEFGQAWIHVYGRPPRGYVQWWQVAAGWSGILAFAAIVRSCLGKWRIAANQRTDLPRDDNAANEFVDQRTMI